MSGGLHSLATIIKRLEAATSRLEDLAVVQQKTLPNGDSISSDLSMDSYGVVNTSPPPPPPPPPSALPAVMDLPKSVVIFDEIIINEKIKKFVELTNDLDVQLLKEQVGHVEISFQDLRTVILTASACTKPDAKGFSDLVAPVRAGVMSAVDVRDKNRKERKWANHLDLLAEGCPSVGWVEIEPKPGPYVAQIKESAEFYGNRIIKEFKEKDQKHVDWVRAFFSLIEEERKYVMEFHTTGLTWNPKGIALSQYLSNSSSGGVSSGSAPPPPPPPPPAVSSAPAVAAGGAAAVFAELNRGEEVTKGLRKVDKSEMTHKNPELRASGVIPAATSSTPKRPAKPTKPQSLMGKKPSKFALEGNKWIIEYQENEQSLIVENVELSHTVNLFGCKNTTVVIKGKLNAVTLANCSKTSVLVESVISSISVTNSPSFALQITGSAPTIQLDSTDSGQIFLSKDCLGVEITTAKCSSINVSLPVEGEEEGVFTECAVPEMLLTTVKNGKLVTSIVEHSS